MAKTPYIRVKGAKARLCGTIPKRVLRALPQEFTWVNVEDFNDRVPLSKGREFYAGIARRVQLWLLHQQGLSVSIRRAKWRQHPDCAEWGLRWPDGWAPRPHQIAAVEAAVAKGSGVIISPARSGKTVMMAMLAEALKAPTLVLVYTKDPRDQLCELLTEKFRFNNAIKPTDGIDFTVMTVGAFTRLNAETQRAWLERIELLMVDETHHAGARSIFKAFRRLPNLQRVYGFTATYTRSDDRLELLQAAMGRVVYRMTRRQAVEQKVNCPVHIKVCAVPSHDYKFSGRIGLSKVTRGKQYRHVYDDYIIEGKTGRNELIAEWAEFFASNNLTFAVVVSRLDHVGRLCELIPFAEPLIGNTRYQSAEEREAVKDRLTHREIMGVITTVLDEATNIPSLDAVILAAGGRSAIKLEQRAMRCATMFQGELRTGFYHKKCGYIVYLKDQADFLSSQSRENIKLLKEFSSDHRSNSYAEVIRPEI